MRVVVAGDYKHPVLLNTTQATAILIETDDGKPNVVFKLMGDREGWIRLTQGEDKNFDEAVRQLVGK